MKETNQEIISQIQRFGFWFNFKPKPKINASKR
jgi:hypothetical protein